jgi:hypothetical protein
VKLPRLQSKILIAWQIPPRCADGSVVGAETVVRESLTLNWQSAHAPRNHVTGCAVNRSQRVFFRFHR